MTSFRSGLYSLFFTLLFLSNRAMAEPGVREPQPSQVDTKVLATIFSGAETLHYSVSWSGGVKIGDIYMEIQSEESRPDTYSIVTKVKDYGPLKLFYPVDDTFRCFVSGPMKLPYRYEVHQQEGYNRDTKRLTLYDQQLRTVRYQKNQGTIQEFAIEGTVYNEFSSFVITRALQFKDGEEIVVPTFVDEKRHEVRVALLKQEKRNTLFGRKTTLKVQPKMHFKGLYDKSGDTSIWLTEDKCRVPVEIHCKIVVGALVAKLTEYSNPACTELSQQPAR